MIRSHVWKAINLFPSRDIPRCRLYCSDRFDQFIIYSFLYTLLFFHAFPFQKWCLDRPRFKTLPYHLSSPSRASLERKEFLERYCLTLISWILRCGKRWPCGLVNSVSEKGKHTLGGLVDRMLCLFFERQLTADGKTNWKTADGKTHFLISPFYVILINMHLLFVHILSSIQGFYIQVAESQAA